MTRGVVLAVIAATSLSHIAHAQAGERTLMHTFQEGSRIVYVTIVDRSSGPLGLVSSEDPSRKERWFTISRSQFNDMRRTLMSSGAQKYAGDEKSDRRFDAVTYYVFSAAEMPHDWKKNYAVPSDNASRTLIALAKQFRDQFRKMALEIPASVERSHMNHPDFRVAGKIFASLGVPDENWGMVKLTPEQQRTFFEKAPEVFRPSSGAWGRQGYTNVYLPLAKTNIVRAALKAAAKNVASKKKKTPNVQRPTLNDPGRGL